MQQILSSIIIIVILVLIAAVIIAICAGPGRLGEGWSSGGRGAAPEEGERRRDSAPSSGHKRKEREYMDPDSEDSTVHYEDAVSWVFELLDGDGRVQQRYEVPDCSVTGVQVGRSAENDIHISGFPDMSRRHLLLRSDNGGVYLIASDYCSSTIGVDGKLVFDGASLRNAGFDQKHRSVKRSKTYLRDGMILQLGSAKLRVSYG